MTGNGLRDALTVVRPGLQTTVQDPGRPGFIRYGVPVSGALDPDRLTLANALVGNDTAAAGLEIRLKGPQLEIHCETLRAAVTCAQGAHVIRAGVPLIMPPFQAVDLIRGDRIEIDTTEPDIIGYLAVSGGIDVAPVMGSRATYPAGGFGGWQGRALQARDSLPVGPQPAPASLPGPISDLPDRTDAPIRLVPGPDRAHFDASANHALLHETFRVTHEIDRIGMRLDGPRLKHSDLGADIASSGTAPGVIQVPGSGRPIVLLADAQTVGGYARIATVISVDLPRLARLKPGAAVRFAAVDRTTAFACARAHAEALAARLSIIRSDTDCLEVTLPP